MLSNFLAVFYIVNSLSLFVGTGTCNARCTNCAGLPLRRFAPKQDGDINEPLIRKAIEDCYQRGARYLSISSSGEPTLSPKSVTKVLTLLSEYRLTGMEFSPINLYSNGIRIGSDEAFCDLHLLQWRVLGLTTIYVTVHDVEERGNAEMYGIPEYPSLRLIVERVHKYDLKMRANLVLTKRYSLGKFIRAVKVLRGLKVDAVSAWPIRDPNDDQIDTNLAPALEDMKQMEVFCKEYQATNPDFKVRFLHGDNKIYQTR